MRIKLVMKEELRTPEIDAWLKECEEKISAKVVENLDAIDRAMVRSCGDLALFGSITDVREREILDEELGR